MNMEILNAHLALKASHIWNGLLKWLLDLVLVFHGSCASKLMLQSTLWSPLPTSNILYKPFSFPPGHSFGEGYLCLGICCFFLYSVTEKTTNKFYLKNANTFVALIYVVVESWISSLADKHLQCILLRWFPAEFQQKTNFLDRKLGWMVWQTISDFLNVLESYENSSICWMILQTLEIQGWMWKISHGNGNNSLLVVWYAWSFSLKSWVHRSCG